MCWIKVYLHAQFIVDCMVILWIQPKYFLCQTAMKNMFCLHSMILRNCLFLYWFSIFWGSYYIISQCSVWNSVMWMMLRVFCVCDSICFGSRTSRSWYWKCWKSQHFSCQRWICQVRHLYIIRLIHAFQNGDLVLFGGDGDFLFW